jgi:hypothetical protein
MTASGPPTPGLVPLHVGQPAPTQEDLADAVARTDALESGRPPRRQRRSALVQPGVEWQKHGADPRWLGMETSDCAAALNPSVFHGRGAAPRRRVHAAARRETALVIATVGNADENSPRSPLDSCNASVDLPGLHGSIHGRRLPARTRPALVAGLSPADRDLGLRLLNRPVEAPWWAHKLGGYTFERADGGPSTTHAAEGELRPILVDTLGDPVVAAWIPPEGGQRWYIIPDTTDWNGLIDWLIHQALPAHVPDVLRRARSPHFVDPDMQTQAELIAAQALAEMTARHAEEKARLEEELERARAAAQPVRYGLLYGTGNELVDAVGKVLTVAGFVTVRLDEELGGSLSADLLATFEQQRRLIEIKSASGNASEALVGDLQRHLATWPELRPQEPVGGGVLIVNHQHKLVPCQRSPQVYTRPEFVGAITVPVIGTRALFGWWRMSNWASIREAILGSAHPVDQTATPPPEASHVPTPTSAAPGRQTWSRRLWRRKGAH